MNLKYWDKHKIATVMAAVLILVTVAIIYVNNTVDTFAQEKAVGKLSYDEIAALQKFSDIYTEELPVTYYILDSVTSLTWIVGLLGSLYAAWTALDIPERYQGKIGETE